MMVACCSFETGLMFYKLCVCVVCFTVSVSCLVAWIFLFVAPCAVFLGSFFFFSSRRRHTRSLCDWSSDVCSSDLGVYPHGWNAKQFAHMVRWGATPLQAIQAATVNAADLLGWRDLVGALEPGKFADVIGVMGDPLQDVTVLEHVGFVMKGGQVVKDSLTGGAKAAR